MYFNLTFIVVCFLCLIYVVLTWHFYIKAPNEVRPPNTAPAPVPVPVSPGPGPRPPLNRADSRGSLQSLTPPVRPIAPPTPQLQQQRPQFQPGGPVNNPPQFAPRPPTPAPRGPAPSGPPLSVPPQQQRPPTPLLRPSGPQTFVPQQGPRPQGPPVLNQSQRAPPPNNLQFGPRQPPQFGVPTTPDTYKPPVPQQGNGIPRNAPPPGPNSRPASSVGQLPIHPSQGSLKGPDTFGVNSKKPVNLENQSATSDNQNANKPENGIDMPGAPKSRSYSIAAAPGTPSPLKMEDDRRKSVSSIGGKFDELTTRSPALGLIQEGKSDLKDNLRGSKESIKSDVSNESAREVPDRPESRLSGSKMSESFIGSFNNLTPKKKLDDDDDVVLQNNSNAPKNNGKVEIQDRSPSLTRSDDSPEPRPIPSSTIPSKPYPNPTPESQRPKTPVKQENKMNENFRPQGIPNTITRPPASSDSKPPAPIKKPTDLNTSITPSDSKKSTPRKIAPASKDRQKDGDNDSGVDESTQGNDANGSPSSPNKKSPSKLPTKQNSSNALKPSLSRSSSKSATAKTPESPMPTEKKKIPMNKVQVGSAPSPNIKTVKSKIGSLDNSTYKPGGGKIKIENRKLDFNKVTPKIAAKNEAYVPSGGTKKITSTKLEWSAKSKVGSLQNTAYKPGGGDKKIETVKLDFKDKAKPKVASTVNITHKPGGGAIKIENQKLEFKAQSKVGSMDNVKHRPGGGDIKIFDDKDYLKQTSGQSPALSHSGQESPIPPVAHAPKSDENLNQQQC